MNRETLKNDITILVCSCDAYEDLWMPFFTLLKRYWSPLDIHIIFNVESKDFSMDGLDIQCVHSKGEKRYGQRMLNALSHVKTKYVFTLLDDFFLRQPVNEERIKQIVSWMEDDENIVYFNCDIYGTYVDYEVGKYPGFKRIPPASYYMLNMQPAIWRTEILKSFWYSDVSPWEWETIFNLLTIDYPQYKFYSAISVEDVFFDYGYKKFGEWFGVCRGKWVIEDVGPLFEKEKIDVDFSIRGIYSRKEPAAKSPKKRYEFLRNCKHFWQIRHWYEFPLFLGYEMRRMAIMTFKKIPVDDYFSYILMKKQERFQNSLNKK